MAATLAQPAFLPLMGLKKHVAVPSASVVSNQKCSSAQTPSSTASAWSLQMFTGMQQATGKSRAGWDCHDKFYALTLVPAALEHGHSYIEAEFGMGMSQEGKDAASQNIDCKTNTPTQYPPKPIVSTQLPLPNLEHSPALTVPLHQVKEKLPLPSPLTLTSPQLPLPSSEHSSALTVRLRQAQAKSSLSSPRTLNLPSSVGRVQSRAAESQRDRWVAEGAGISHLTGIIDRLKNVESSAESLEASLEGWMYPLTWKDMCTILRSQTWRKALFFFKWLKQRQYPINRVTYNVLLGILRRGGQFQLAEEMAEEMISEQVELDNYTYSILISCAALSGSLDKALKWFERMYAVGCVPDEVTVSSMIFVYDRARKFKEAILLYCWFRQSGWMPDEITYTGMVSIYIRAGMHREAADMVREMIPKGFQPDAMVYNKLIRLVAREGMFGQARRLFEEMECMEIKPSKSTLSLMIDVYSRIGNVEEALKLFARMKELKQHKDIVVYNSLLKACGIDGLLQQGFDFFDELKQNGLKLNEVTYKSLMNVYAREGKVEDAVALFQEFVEAGYAPDIVVYSCLIKACGRRRNFKMAEEFFEKLMYSNSPMDNRCCGLLLSLLSICVHEEDRIVVRRCIQKASQMLSCTLDVMLTENAARELVENQITALLLNLPSDALLPFCNSLIDICWSQGQTGRALDVLTIADSLGVYRGGIETHTAARWTIHLRSLSRAAALCVLESWITTMQSELAQEKELPEILVIETGAHKLSWEGPRMFSFILSQLQEVKAPFGPSSFRADWLVSTGPAMALWLRSVPSSVTHFVQIEEV